MTAKELDGLQIFFKSMFVLIHNKLVDYGIQSTFVKEIVHEIAEELLESMGLDIKDFGEAKGNK